MNKPSTTQEEIKNTLKAYSKFLRRDFLAILVKMSARELGIKTVRSDWRTRKGMLTFLQNSWARFTPLLAADTIFQWYCHYFDYLEKIFSKRKFIMFLYANWDKYGDFMKSDAAIAFMRAHQTEIENILNTQSTKRSRAWNEVEAGTSLNAIIEHFSNGLVEPIKEEVIIIPQDIQPIRSPITKPQKFETIFPEIDSEFLNIDFEVQLDVIEPLPYDPLLLPPLLDEPLMLDDFHL